MNNGKKAQAFDWFEDQMKKMNERHEAMLSKMNRKGRRRYWAEGRRRK